MMKIVEVNNNNFEKEVLNSKETVLVDFNADWCGPCRMLKPSLEELAKEKDNVKIVSINIDDEYELAEQYGVQSIPCLVLFKNGKEEKRNVGLISKDEIINLIGE